MIVANRTLSSVVPAILSLLLSAGCGDKAADLQQTANKAQDVADEKIGAAEAKSDGVARDAQADADKKIAAAAASFTTLREDYRHSVTVRLADLDARIATKEADARAATGANRTRSEAKLVLIRSDRDAFKAAFSALDGESATTWDVARDHLDAEWTELTARVDG